MATMIRMPQLGLTMEEGTIDRWIKQEGETVKKGEILLEITTDKLTNEVESEVDGILLKILAQEGEDIPVKGILCVIGENGETVQIEEQMEDHKTDFPSAWKQAETERAVNQDTQSIQNRIRISPLAKKTAEKGGVDYTQIIGSGSGGRIVQKDILVLLEQSDDLANTKKTPGKIVMMEGDTVEKLTGMRKAVADHMTRSHTEIPAVTQTIKIDATELLQFRTKMNQVREHKFSVNDLILKAVANALKYNQDILVSIDGGNLIHRAHINLGMAVALNAGLIVPVIHDADKLSLGELSLMTKDLIQRARENRLTLSECEGSTFTVTNLGMFGIESFTPIINQPDAAILGVCAAQTELDMNTDGTLCKKQMMRLSLTFDHRLMDGAVAARFQQDLQRLLENPMEIIL